MVSRILSITLAFALVATASFAAGEEEQRRRQPPPTSRYVTDPVTGTVYRPRRSMAEHLSTYSEALLSLATSGLAVERVKS